MTKSLEIALVVEDVLSLVVMEKVLSHTGRHFLVMRPQVERGIGNIQRSIHKYRTASHALAHVVLVDLDHVACPPLLRSEWELSNLPQGMLFRVAVRSVEAWLLADRTGFASFAGIPQNKVSQHPESLDNPKQTLINLVRRSRNRRLASELVPTQGSSVPIGPLYNERLSKFVRDQWDVDSATKSSPSLKRTLDRLQHFMN
ncbi:MAG: hypothetical protein NTU86_08780 [Burkholderiales bacterium]|nr:hypothetical protein [Burkholderiales bacterium]